MHHLETRARSLAVIAFVASLSATALAVPPAVQAPIAPAVKPETARPETAPPPPPPPTKGWPSTIQSAAALSPDKCNRAPTANEVIVYANPSFGGSCAILTPGFYPHGENLGVGDDAISSLKVGSGVRARAFLDPIYGGNVMAYLPGSSEAGLGSFNDKISSMRIEPGNRSASCNDLKEGELAFWRDPNERGDCVVLLGDWNPHDHRTGAPTAPAYPNAESMGIADDSISSLKNNTSFTLTIYADPNFSSNMGGEVPPHSGFHALPRKDLTHDGIDDHISSVKMKQ